MGDPARLAESIRIASDVLKLSTLLSVRKGAFGGLKPNQNQIAWSYGFCDGYAQSIGLETDEEFILFISMTFERVFGKRGLRYFRTIVTHQDRYLEPIIQGGTAQNLWIKEGKPPLMPMRD